MLAVSLNPASPGTSSAIELLEVARPAISLPTDVVLMVTTTVIGPWEMRRARRGGGATTPGAQFAGIVVEIGKAVTTVDIDDLVVATCTVPRSGPARGAALFGAGSLPGGHAEYVRVPEADRVLVKTTPGAEERSVFAGGAAALGFAAAERALERVGDGPILVIGCNAAALSALAWVKHKRGNAGPVYAIDSHPARLAAVKSYGAQVFNGHDLCTPKVRAVITGSEPADLPTSLPPDAPVISTNPCGNSELSFKFGPELTVAANWPTLEQARRAEMAIRLRQVDLTPLVSTVLPLDEAAEGYRLALESPPGTRSVLLKP